MKSLEEIRAALEGKGYRVVVEGNTLTATRDGELHRIKVEGARSTWRPSAPLWTWWRRCFMGKKVFDPRGGKGGEWARGPRG